MTVNNPTKPPFSIRVLEHVGILSIDREKSAQWYQKTLGLTPGHPPIKRGDPLIMLAGQTGVAIFQADTKKLDNEELSRRIDHFAFQVSMEDFKNSQKHFQKLNIPFTVKDHYYVLSLYIKDPDGHVVELTTPIRSE